VIIRKTYEEKAVLLRCGCSHNFVEDFSKYEHKLRCKHSGLCPKCELFGWTIDGLNYKQLGQRDRVTLRRN
jgi:hypothetical protein